MIDFWQDLPDPLEQAVIHRTLEFLHSLRQPAQWHIWHWDQDQLPHPEIHEALHRFPRQARTRNAQQVYAPLAPAPEQQQYFFLGLAANHCVFSSPIGIDAMMARRDPRTTRWSVIRECTLALIERPNQPCERTAPDRMPWIQPWPWPRFGPRYAEIQNLRAEVLRTRCCSVVDIPV